MKKILILYAMVIGYILLSNFGIFTGIPLYNELIVPIIWIIMCTVTMILCKDESIRVKDESNKTQSLLIVLIVYIILYYLLGLLFGFQKTPYARDLGSILKNVWSFGSIVVFQEFIRNAMIRTEKDSKLNFVITTILFILVNLSISETLNQYNIVREGFTYTVSTIIPLIVTSIVMTYLSYIGGVKLPIMYRLFVLLPEFIIPIMPALDWFGTALIGILLPIATFVYLNYVHIKKTARVSKRVAKKYNPIVYAPTVAFVLLLAAFVVGVFKYQPIAVLSGSMSPTFNRGDAVVIEKLTDAEKDNLQVGDIVQFASGSNYVIHRIVDISNDGNGNRTFITKGDYNNAKDSGTLTYDKIIGKEKFIIPYIGYPSVWLSGAIS